MIIKSLETMTIIIRIIRIIITIIIIDVVLNVTINLSSIRHATRIIPRAQGRARAFVSLLHSNVGCFSNLYMTEINAITFKVK